MPEVSENFHLTGFSPLSLSPFPWVSSINLSFPLDWI